MPEIDATTTDQHAFTDAETAGMRAALEAACRGPRSANPVVGAVLLDADGRILHTGRHRGAGTPHAEADLLAQAQRAGTPLEDTTLLVTLEPCDRTGRTGACSRAVLRAGIPRVVYATADTTPMAGGGERLRRAGVQVRSGLLEGESLRLNERWAAAAAAGRPFVTAKTAQSADGRIAAADGTSRWITGPQARADGHRLRARADAVAVGTGTVLADDPRLTVRLTGPDAQERPDSSSALGPWRVVIGTREVPDQAAMRGTDGRFLHLRTRDLRAALAELHGHGIRHLMVEGGAGLISALMAEDLIDEWVIHQAPTVLGGGRPALEMPALRTLTDAVAWEPDPVDGPPARWLGPDLRLHLRPAPRTTTRNED